MDWKVLGLIKNILQFQENNSNNLIIIIKNTHTR